jgi:hypothetical protein
MTVSRKVTLALGIQTVASRQLRPIVSDLVASGSGVMASCYGDFVRELMRGSHDLLRQKPTTLLIMLGWNSISISKASLTM